MLSDDNASMQASHWLGQCTAETFDRLMNRHFGPGELDELSPDEYDAAIERLRAGFRREFDPQQKFSLWALLHLFDEAPAIESTFTDPSAIDAARRFVILWQPETR